MNVHCDSDMLEPSVSVDRRDHCFDSLWTMLSLRMQNFSFLRQVS